MKIQDIIRTIEMLKADFQSRYGVEPNTCTLSEDLYMELAHYFESMIKRSDALEVNRICGMNLSIDLENDRSVQGAISVGRVARNGRSKMTKIKYIESDSLFYECPNCGEEIEMGQKYCGECGESFEWIDDLDCEVE